MFWNPSGFSSITEPSSSSPKYQLFKIMINDQDISIIVQGPVFFESAYQVTPNATQLVFMRLRKLFPKSELILSTWEGEKVDGIPFDKLILNKDPGATWFTYKNYKLLNNCNRLIVSTQAGLQAATRPYVLKIRSDLFMISKKFLDFFNQFPSYDSKYTFVRSRILAFSIYSLKSEKNCLFTMERPFHISDWAYFGYKEDLLNYYDVPLVQEPEFSHWFLRRFKPFRDIELNRLWKMSPEQYITSSFFKKYIPFEFEHSADTSNQNKKLSERLIANNFLVLDQTQFSLISLKYFNLQLLYPSTLSKTSIFFSFWLKDYIHYCHISIRENILKYKIQILWRTFWYRFFNVILNFLNKKNIITKLLCIYIKKLSKKLIY